MGELILLLYVVSEVTKKKTGELYWDDFRLTKNQAIGPIYLRLSNMSNKNELPMQLLLTVVPKGVYINDVVKHLVEQLKPLYSDGMSGKFLKKE